MPRLAEDMQDQADQPLVDSEDKVGQTLEYLVSSELCLIPGHCISKRFSISIIQYYRHLQFIGTDLKTSLFVLSMVWFME